MSSVYRYLHTYHPLVTVYKIHSQNLINLFFYIQSDVRFFYPNVFLKWGHQICFWNIQFDEDKGDNSDQKAHVYKE